MAKKKYRKRVQRATALAPLIPAAAVIYNDYKNNNGFNKAMVNEVSNHLIGYSTTNRTFNPSLAMPTWLATIAGVVIHKVANAPRVGINKYVRKATLGYFEF